MNDLLFKNVIRAKFQLTQAMMSYLPANIQERVYKVQGECMASLREVIDSLPDDTTKQAEENSPTSHGKPQGVTKVKIE